MATEKPRTCADNTDRRMMTSDYSWPGFYLPLKRFIGSRLECAYLVNPVVPGQPADIRKGNVFAPSENDPKLPYADIEAVIADGWVVD